MLRSTEPHWRPASQSTPLTPQQRLTLLDEGSLTATLKQLSGGDFRVTVLQQCWQSPRHSEAQLLMIDPRAACLIREVLLIGKGQPWIFARSVMPAMALTGHLYRLRRLKNSSLGELLFRDHSLQRSEFELGLFPPPQTLLAETISSEETLIGRRCRFELSGKSLMVSEIFLPALWQTLATHSSC
jgi:chorismate--pyruvate lyase